MKLIVFKDLSTAYWYGAKIIDKLPYNSINQKVGKTIIVVKAYNFNPSSLRGYQFDEVLWVGYEDTQDRDFTAPMEILAQTHGAKHHYCKPTDPGFDKFVKETTYV